jgi:periplasmic copper chaperone A
MSHVVRLHLFALLTLLLAPVCASAGDPALAVSDAWFRALPSGLPAGGYFTLHNNGSAPVSLTSAESSACGMLMLHKSENDGGMSSMSELASVDVPAGKSASFAPGGYHLMCMQPAAAMKPGGTVKVTFTFAGGPKLDAEFAVRNAAGK